MTEQTLVEKLRILADAAEAGEASVLLNNTVYPIDYCIANAAISRVPPKPATIKVGDREINAPLRVMPRIGAEYWYVSTDGTVRSFYCYASNSDREMFNNANCWATKSDAEAYRDAALAVRKGEV